NGDSDVTLESSSPPPPTASIPRDSGVFNEPDSDESWSISSSSYSTTPFKRIPQGDDDLSLGIASLELNPNGRNSSVKSTLTTSRTLNFHLMSTNGENNSCAFTTHNDTQLSQHR
ncbi:Uncharacterized protein FKW44_011399, partial [Caligus rogercresseyi]